MTSAQMSSSRTILCFDFGTRRIGVAVGREAMKTASALSPIPARDGIPDWRLMAALIDEWQPDHFVVGLPLDMDGTENEMCQRARKFANRLKGRYHKPFDLVDERLTSHSAKSMARERESISDFKDHSIDGIAACLILQDWYETRS